MGWATGHIAKSRSGEVVSFRPRGGSMSPKIESAVHGQRFQIGNNRGRINGWIGPNAIFGRLVQDEP